MCGITGIYCRSGIPSPLLFKSLKELQHRGHDSYGYSDGLVNQKYMGLVNKPPEGIVKKIAVGHVRYRTSGCVGLEECQPLVNKQKDITLVHNGNVEKYEGKTDSHYLLSLISGEKDIMTGIKHVIQNIEGAFFIILIHNEKMYAFKDRYGIRPGGFWMEGSNVIISSERRGKYYSDIGPGEIVVVDQDIKVFKTGDYYLKPCIFEYIYLLHPSSIVYDISVDSFRRQMGKKSIPLLGDDQFDIVVGIPKTARLYGQEISSALGIPYTELIRNHTSRSFILPTQHDREEYIKKKFSFPSECFAKRVLLVDDSIVRGTVSKHVIRELRKGGAEYICFLSCSPKVVKRNVYGVNIVSEQELISYGRTHDQICSEIGADRLIFQTIENLYQVTGFKNMELSVYGK